MKTPFRFALFSLQRSLPPGGRRLRFRRRRRTAFAALVAFCFVFAFQNESERRPQPGDTVFAQTDLLDAGKKTASPTGGYRYWAWRVVFNGVAWIVDDENGRIAAFDDDGRKPLWSDDGIVFQFPRRFNGRPSQTHIIQTLNNAPRRAASAFGRVYFLLASPTDGAERSALNVLLALDPQAQGRLVWIRRADDFERFFSPTSDSTPCEFVGPPRPAPNDVVNIEVKRDDKRIGVSLNVADGTVLSTF